MEPTNPIADPIVARIWNQYIKRAKRILISIPDSQRDEIMKELQSHLFESYQHDSGGSDVEKMLNAIENLGDPDDYLEPIVRDILQSNIYYRYSPMTIMKKLVLNPVTNLKNFLFSILLGSGYVVMFIVFIATVAKVFIPTVGLYTHKSGGFSISANAPESSQDILGNWLIPAGFLVSIVLYILLTKLLNTIYKK